MLRSQFKAFVEFRDEFRARVAEWSQFASMLEALQRSAAQKDTPDYPIETTVVYNRALDDISERDEIKLIVIGDNPGKDEQLAINNRYLVGQSGKIADGFFRRNSELQIDFRKNAIILNKTPLHTAKTHHLRSLQKADSEIAKLIDITQLWMAEHTAKLHCALWENGAGGKKGERSRADTGGEKNDEYFNPAQLWLVGYAELKERGIFAPYRDALKAAYAGSDAWTSVFVYQHFSMNRFLIDLKAYQKNRASDGNTSDEKPSLAFDLEKLGEFRKKEIFGE